ncbi:sulfonate ABC transporter substrate-binding protein [Providencia stuartii]|uniref:Putative aliphatic sulfonates-binding protein n=1 Tax=Providencia stuartii TaxID=588 RepID=A0AAI9D8K5_PROST|nr:MULTISPECIES: sulfonate ABC transporter substrate-binding protein [Providencia]ELR5111480.1 sulfonate ABC transporter substrate-binding protein [Providencia stuartii]ELR5298365.1 sulfonate ABC transporter substrate-binding protein [Providencia stuartii]MDW7586812.1 sulfonate ABC transporter substrate-binding protein [Providencia sp. 2023EL-00965]
MLFASLLVVSIYSSFSFGEVKTINIGYQKANIFALLKYRGTLENEFKKHDVNIRWIEFPAGPQMLEGLNVGSIDLAATGDAPPIFAQAAQADFVYLGHSPANPKSEAIIVPNDSSIKSINDLKGKRVALNKGSDVNYLLVAALQHAGLNYRDITPVYLPPSDARAAFEKGVVDAWAIWDPFLAEVETNLPVRQIVNGENLVPHYTFFLASRNFAEKSPKYAEVIIEQLVKQSEWANTHPQETAEILSVSTGLDNAIWLKALQRAQYGFTRMDDETLVGQQKIADIFTKIGLIPNAVDVKQARWVSEVN